MERLALGLEIGGTKLQAALGTYEGAIIERERGEAAAGAGAEQILAWFEEHVPGLIARAEGDGKTVGGVGIGFGGPVESAAGRAILSHQVEGWKGFPLQKWCESKFGLPTHIANDANAAGWAEYSCGAGKGTRTFCYINVGSGIGGSLVIDGKLHDGQGLGAFEIGHTYVADPTSNIPGESSKLERLYSGWSIERRLRSGPALEEGTELHRLCEGDRSRITCALLAQAAEAGDAHALSAVEEIARGLGLAIANCITLIHPERFVLGGGVFLMGDVLLEPLRTFVDRHVIDSFRGTCEILPAALGEDVVLVGALLLARIAAAE